MWRPLDVTSSWLASASRGTSGLGVAPLAARPEKQLELYEFEGCPFCRKVREALSELDLEARVYPCPKNGRRFRPRVLDLGGKELFPYLVDPNTQTRMYESNDINRYLFSTYGAGRVSLGLALGPLTTLSSVMASAWRGPRGVRARASRAPDKPLELWSFEASPYCRIAREALCELELPYLLHNVAQNSPSRPAFIQRSGKMMVPYLVDPNTGTEMFESADIVRYLNATYAV
jgi:glutathione S-transferase